MSKKGFDDRGQGLGRREVGNKPLAIIDNTLAGDGVCDMRILITQFRPVATRFAVSRAVIVAILLGPVVGAMLAVGAVAAQDATNVITIDNFTFTPPELTVAVGTTVKWVNHDDIPHLVVNKDKAFRSKALDTDDSFSYTFASAGTFDYFCGLHPHMVGKVIVK